MGRPRAPMAGGGMGQGIEQAVEENKALEDELDLMRRMEKYFWDRTS